MRLLPSEWLKKNISGYKPENSDGSVVSCRPVAVLDGRMILGHKPSNSDTVGFAVFAKVSEGEKIYGTFTTKENCEIMAKGAKAEGFCSTQTPETFATYTEHDLKKMTERKYDLADVSPRNVWYRVFDDAFRRSQGYAAQYGYSLGFSAVKGGAPGMDTAEMTLSSKKGKISIGAAASSFLYCRT